MANEQREFPNGPTFPHGGARDLELVRTRPRFYLHRLAQYMEATPLRRRSLLVNEKFPSAFQTSYEPAKRLFRLAVRNRWSKGELLRAAYEAWDSQAINGSLAQERFDLARRSVMAFSSLLRPLTLALGAARASTDLEAVEPLFLESVLVSDGPLVSVMKKSDGLAEFGLVSLHSSKSRTHTPASARNAAALLVAVANENCPVDAAVNGELCLVVDVFGQLIVSGDHGNTLRLRQAEAACDEVARLWNSV